MGFKKKARKGPKKGPREFESSGTEVEELVEGISSGSEVGRLLFEHNRIMKMAAFPNNGLIFECRKFTEMALIAYIQHHGIVINPADNKTLDGLIQEIKNRPELTVSKLTLKHIESLRAYGNIASHAQLEIESPREIWDAIKNPFEKVAKWILVEVHSVDEDVLLKPQSASELIEGSIGRGVRNLGADGEWVNFNDIWNDKNIHKSFLSSMQRMTMMAMAYMPVGARYLDNAMVIAIRSTEWEEEKKLMFLSYCWKMAWWSSMGSLQGILTDYDTLYSDIDETDFESRGEITRMLQEWMDDNSRARKED